MHIMKRIVVFLVAIFTLTALNAQDNKVLVQVERSRDKVKIDGTTYYIHIVKSGETLYAISRAYDIAQSVIATNNPDIYAGLKVGQALKIPKRSKEPESDENYVYHIVKKKETLFGLSRQYNVSIDEIVEINPEVKEGLQQSQTIRIPRVKATEHIHKPASDTLTFIMHEVQPKEGLFAISRRYGVDAKEIELYNKELLDDGVKLGTSLRIPVKPASDSTIVKVDAKVDTPKVEVPEVHPTVPLCSNNYVYGGELFNIALFLPFTQSGGGASDGSIDDATDGNSNSKSQSSAKKGFSQITQASLEFYEGFLLAVDSMKRSGVSVNLSVFDTKRKQSEVQSIVNRGAVKQSDLIIGSFMIDDLKPLLNFASSNRVNLVSPLYNGATAMPSSSNIIALNQSFRKQLEIFIRNFKFEDTCRYVVVYDKDNLYSSNIKLFDSLLTAKIHDSSRIRKVYHQTAVRKSADVQEALTKELTADMHNVIIIPSEDEPFVSEFLGHLYGVKSYYNLRTTVYGPARWQTMRNIPTDYFYKLNLNVFTPFFVDYTRPSVKRFIVEYRDLYRAEPSQYSYLGYDVGLYFILAMKNYGVDFNQCLYSHRLFLLQSDFWFGNVNTQSAFQNERQFIINYTGDFDVKIVK